MTIQHLESRNRRIQARKQGRGVIGVIVMLAVVLVLALGLFIILTNLPQPQGTIPHQTEPVAIRDLLQAVIDGGLRLGH